MQARTSFPNLTVSALLHVQDAFDNVVLRGARADKGMGAFAKEMKADDAVAVREYLIARANALKAGSTAVVVPPPPAPPPPRRETGHAEN
jgi:hypothetical protein